LHILKVLSNSNNAFTVNGMYGEMLHRTWHLRCTCRLQVKKKYLYGYRYTLNRIWLRQHVECHTKCCLDAKTGSILLSLWCLIKTNLNISASIHCKKIYEIPGFFFDQTFLGLEQGTLFPARESLVSDIPAGDRFIAKFISNEQFIKTDRMIPFSTAHLCR